MPHGSPPHRLPRAAGLRPRAAWARSARAAAGLAVAAALLSGLPGCGSVSAEVRSLNAEERQVSEQVNLLQERRKAIIALATALEVYGRDASRKNKLAVAQARDRYELARARTD